MNYATYYCPEDDKLRLYVGHVPQDEYKTLKKEGWTSTPKHNKEIRKMRNKHTPGPWGVKYIGGNRIAIVRPGYSRIATMLPNDKTREMDEANAALIAKAPELLEALRDMASEIQSRLHKLNVRRDFSLMNYHAAAAKLIHMLDTGVDQ